MSPITVMHPAKAAGRNEMPLARGTRESRVVPSNTVLAGAPFLQRNGAI